MGNVTGTKPLVTVTRTDVVLGSGQNGDSAHVDIRGARAVAFIIKASDPTTLTTCVAQVNYPSGLQVNVATGAAGASQDSGLLNAVSSGALTGVALNDAALHMFVLRSESGTGFFVEPMYGVDKAQITLTRAVAGGTTTYTVWTLVYFNG